MASIKMDGSMESDSAVENGKMIWSLSPGTREVCIQSELCTIINDGAGKI